MLACPAYGEPMVYAALIRRCAFGPQIAARFGRLRGIGNGQARLDFILAATMSSMMVAMVTLIVTFLNSACRTISCLQWVKAYIIAWPIAAVTGYLIMPMARRFTDRRRHPDRRRRLMLSALDLARRHREPANSRPRRRSSSAPRPSPRARREVGAFVTLDLDGARKAAQRRASRTSRCAACRSR